MTDQQQPHDYEIIRHEGNKPGEPPSFATYGRCYDAQGNEIMVTLELPWVDADADGKRDPKKSRFAPGLYRVTVRKSHLNGGNGKRTYDVPQFKSEDHDPTTTDDTPDTNAAQIHIANLPYQLEACVATGTAFGPVEDSRDSKLYRGVQGSRLAFKKFMRDMLALMQRERRDHVWIRVTDRLEQ